MRLSNLIACNEGLKLHGSDPDINGVTVDSREVKPGFLFIAIPGTKYDGRIYISDAVKQGAAAILAPEGTKVDKGVTYVTASDMRRAASAVAANFYSRQPETIAAITGTSGKTSVAQFTREIWQQLGFASASIGTLGLISAKESKYGTLTTPETTELYHLLDYCAEQKISHLALEASSHGLAMHRLDHVRAKIGAFTNLSRDHLDYHETMDHYFAAKLRLFTEVLPPGAVAVLNADSDRFKPLLKAAEARDIKVIAYGKKASDIKLLGTKLESAGQSLSFELFGKKHEILLPVMGAFQAWNGLCALGIALASGAKEDRAIAALGKISGVPGRLQLVGRSAKGGTVFVDYAHKPDALENVLNAMRPHTAQHKGKLGIVFGCGGNRDKGKRPLMGAAAHKLADWAIVTDDNPRNENPAVIRKEIMGAGKAGPDFREIGDRAQAIEAGIARLGKNDVLIVAGKGHESGQIIGDKVIPFDDADVVRKALGT